MTIQSMNNSLKIYLNEASGISTNCRKKLLKLVDKHFYVELPKDNYLNVDLELLDNGNIIMREVEYKTSNPIKKKSELEERFNGFKLEVEELLNKNETNFKSIRRNNEIGNLLIVLLILLAMIFVIGYSLDCLLSGDLRGFIWILFIIFVYIIPYSSNKISDRFRRAFRFIKKLFK